MRKTVINSNISVHAIAGQRVILLALDVKIDDIKGLLGFTILKRKGPADDNNEKFCALSGGKDFDNNIDDGAGQLSPRRVDSKTLPIQAFMWGDYSIEAGLTYTYHIIPVYGKPGVLTQGNDLYLTITAESLDSGTHSVYFNRGVAGSQAYSRRFGKYRRWYLTPDYNGKLSTTPFIKPSDVPNRDAYKWLSRGLEEAMIDFIDQASGTDYSIRASFYEFTHDPIIRKFVDALERGVDVKIIHHAKLINHYLLKKNTGATTITEYNDSDKDEVEWSNLEGVKEPQGDSVFQATEKAVSEVGLTVGPDDEKFDDYVMAFNSMLIKRTITNISHNKFMILLKDKLPVQVWTGSTNLTSGGIYGQSNVGHIIRDAEVATKYHDYWLKLSTDPKKKSTKSEPDDLGLQNWTVKQQPVPEDLPLKSITPIFSPRLKPAKGDKEILDWYAERLDGAKHSVFLTLAFSIAEQFFDILKKVKMVDGAPYESDSYLRYLLLEGKGGHFKNKYPIIKKCSQNQIAYGDILRRREGDDGLLENLTGLNNHVNYVHNKFMLIDPLTDDPIVISGSANFSDASVHDNDENMLIIRGNTKVADIFLCEFMRLFKHFERRNVENALSEKEKRNTRFLKNDDSWTIPYFEDGTPEQKERTLFSNWVPTKEL